MPTLKIHTNVSVSAADRDQLLASASRTVAKLLDKPERYVMIVLEPPAFMLFAGNDAPAAYLELKSLDLPEHKTAELSAALAQWIGTWLKVSADRLYIEFCSPPRHLFGFNGGTF